MSRQSPYPSPNRPDGYGGVPDAINLSWTDSPANVNGYNVWRSTNGTTFSTVATLGSAATSWSDTTLSAGTTYYYEVSADITEQATASIPTWLVPRRSRLAHRSPPTTSLTATAWA